MVVAVHLYLPTPSSHRMMMIPNGTPRSQSRMKNMIASWRKRQESNPQTALANRRQFSRLLP